MLLVITIGYQPGGFGFFGMALIISGVSSFVSYYYSDKIVLGISGARPANPQEDKLFTQVAENFVSEQEFQGQNFM